MTKVPGLPKVPGDCEEPLDGDSKDGVEGAGQADLGDGQQYGNQYWEDLHIFQFRSICRYLYLFALSELHYSSKEVMKTFT